MKIPLTYEAMDRLTRNRWFYILLVVIPAITPPFASKGLGPLSQLGDFIWGTVQALLIKKNAALPLMPFLHATLIALIYVLIRRGNKIRVLMTTLIGLHYAVMAYFQTIAVSERYGVIVLTEGLIWFLAVALVWIWEATLGVTDFTFRKRPLKEYWVVPLAIFAFWDPDQAWNFDPGFLITSTSPIAICMMTTIYLAILNLLFPNVNLPAFRITSFVGIIFSGFTLLGSVFMDAREGAYWIFLHIPMLIISVYSLRRALRSSEPQGSEP
jgi:hypothetical protein